MILANTNLLQVSAAVGVALPILVAVVKEQKWSSRTKSIIGVVSSVIAAVATAAIEHKLSSGNVIGSLAAVYAAEQITFGAFWKPTGVDNYLADIVHFFEHPPAPPTPPASTSSHK